MTRATGIRRQEGGGRFARGAFLWHTPPVQDLGRTILILGVVLVVIGIALTLGARLGIGKVPGDVVYRRGNFTFYFPIVTSIVLSVVLSLLFWLFRSRS